MNVTEALNSRLHLPRFQVPSLSTEETIMAILEAANRTPSWANTQPWEIFVAGGDVLEGLRQACLENFHQGVPGSSDLPRPEHGRRPSTERMHGLMAARSRTLGIDREDEAAPGSARRAEPPLLRGAGRRLPVHGPLADVLVRARPRHDGAEHHAGGQGAGGGFSHRLQPGHLSGPDPQGAGYPRRSGDRHRHRPGLCGHREIPRTLSAAHRRSLDEVVSFRGYLDCARAVVRSDPELPAGLDHLVFIIQIRLVFRVADRQFGFQLHAGFFQGGFVGSAQLDLRQEEYRHQRQQDDDGAGDEETADRAGEGHFQSFDEIVETGQSGPPAIQAGAWAIMPLT